ncbi:Tlg2-vesicle protein [Serendipita sp. 398]|nr:Tlg2-vesicle protein [Serendipita sp. 398]
MSGLVEESFWTIYSWIKNVISKSIKRYQKLKWLGKLLVILVMIFYICLVCIFIVIGPDTIFQYFYNLSQQLRKMEYGWLFLGTALVIASFPPMVGFTTLLSIAGERALGGLIHNLKQPFDRVCMGCSGILDSVSGGIYWGRIVLRIPAAHVPCPFTEATAI